ncbi:hypothetical protein [Hydrogenivirga sp. 128-5-R1-1]|uniref:hypothetical protein n=1 Tax=Hydrogenivirga sp. 128-5-R1-1 TaxID=392423 RepID=UPI00015F0D30|nr:hypothetical protein [Hydrogenivirga sp. 128-5-R1-1]EDP75952.1 hypothetical protein HG1285_06485 [Hydrogenivirga sp. 128-5-R1-1]
MADLQELAVSFGKFVAERDEIQIDDITEDTVEEVVREFIRQVLKGKSLSEDELALVHVAVEHGLFDGATVNEMEG